MSCFDIAGGLEIDGMQFQYICGFVEDSLYWELFPKIYNRGPGTSPGQQISLGTHVSIDELKRWWQASGPTGQPDFSDYSAHLDYLEGKIAEIGCKRNQ